MPSEANARPNILAVEDDPNSQLFLKKFLRQWFDITTCPSDRDFYAEMERENWDLIIMDISIDGEKDGLELTRELKNDPNRSHIPVVCVTAHAFDKDKEKALTAGCDAYLSKPYDNNTLVETIFEQLQMIF